MSADYGRLYLGSELSREALLGLLSGPCPCQSEDLANGSLLWVMTIISNLTRN